MRAAHVVQFAVASALDDFVAEVGQGNLGTIKRDQFVLAVLLGAAALVASVISLISPLAVAVCRSRSDTKGTAPRTSDRAYAAQLAKARPRARLREQLQVRPSSLFASQTSLERRFVF